MEISEDFLKVLTKAKNVTVLTGAGVSAESGIKTFRDPDGLWAQFNPAELASVNGFMANPELVWAWYQHRVDIVHNAKPNPGHIAIAQMESIFSGFVLITQNVDRLHQRAGSKKVWELHGNIIENHCFSCHRTYTGETDLPDKKLPSCDECGGMIRPSVVWFGEMLPYDALTASEEAAANSDVFFTVGTSAEVYPAANLPMIAKRAGAYCVEVNPNKTPLSPFMDICFRDTSANALPQILNAYYIYIKSGDIRK